MVQTQIKPNVTIEDLGEKQHSCKIAINAKGQWSGELKVYAETLDEAVKLATGKAIELEVLIREKNGGN